MLRSHSYFLIFLLGYSLFSCWFVSLTCSLPIREFTLLSVMCYTWEDIAPSRWSAVTCWVPLSSVLEFVWGWWSTDKSLLQLFVNITLKGSSHPVPGMNLCPVSVSCHHHCCHGTCVGAGVWGFSLWARDRHANPPGALGDGVGLGRGEAPSGSSLRMSWTGAWVGQSWDPEGTWLGPRTLLANAEEVRGCSEATGPEWRRLLGCSRWLCLHVAPESVLGAAVWGVRARSGLAASAAVRAAGALWVSALSCGL